ncbi:MAG: NAD(+)/NADH kinase [Canidatus Methanoxibalbensis ujae]|nr:NAD(+)/NADH kinase [Candidatus Methanoxibalbensis ujae]
MGKRFDLRFSKHSIGIVCRGSSDDVLLAKRLHEHIKSLRDDITVLVDEGTARKLHVEGCDIGDIDADFIICIGGDGTILRTLHLMRKTLPVLGVNTGDLGFLTEVQPENAFDVIAEMLKMSRCTVEREERLSVRIDGNDHIPYAMNEAVIITAKPGKMLHLAIFMDDEEIERIRADGLILATPIGSTAYAMSAGGPIVDTSVEAMIIVPIAPFKLAARPIVADIDRNISIKTLSEKEVELVIDGQFYRRISSDKRILITRGEPAYFVRVQEYQMRIKEKLLQVC